MKPFLTSLREAWKRLSWLDIVCLAVVAMGLLIELLAANGGIFSFLAYLGVLAGLYLVFRFIGWWRSRLLWSLRNRLIVAYMFIAVVPIVSIVILVVLAARILYSQLGAYLLYEDLHQRIALIADIAEHIGIAHETLPASITRDESERVLAAESQAVHDKELPGLDIKFTDNFFLLDKVAQKGKTSFAGLLEQEGEKDPLFLISMRVIQDPKERRCVILRLPVGSDFLSTVAPDLGVIQLNLMERYEGTASKGVLYSSGEKQYRLAGSIVASNRVLQPPLFWFDSPVNVVSRLDSVFVPTKGPVDPARPVLAVSNARPSRLNARIF